MANRIILISILICFCLSACTSNAPLADTELLSVAYTEFVNAENCHLTFYNETDVNGDISIFDDYELWYSGDAWLQNQVIHPSQSTQYHMVIDGQGFTKNAVGSAWERCDIQDDVNVLQRYNLHFLFDPTAMEIISKEMDADGFVHIKTADPDDVREDGTVPDGYLTYTYVLDSNHHLKYIDYHVDIADGYDVVGYVAKRLTIISINNPQIPQAIEAERYSIK